METTPAAEQGGQTRSGLPDVLSAEEVQQYHRDGFLVPRFRLSPDEVSRLRELTFRLMADNPEMAKKMMNCPHVPGVGGLKSGPGWMEFAAHPEILDMVEQVMGEDIILRGSVVFHKEPGKGPATPWHRDVATIPLEPLAGTSVWIAASEARIENACLRYIPGSHKSKSRGLHRHDKDEKLTSGMTLDESEYDESAAVDIEVEAGQMVIFDIFTVHGSRPNLGTRERASYALRYMPGTSRFNHDAIRPAELRGPGYVEPGNRPLILVRGQDRAGNDFMRGHPN